MSVLFRKKGTSANSPHLFLGAIVLYKKLHSSLLERILWWWPHPFSFCGTVVSSSLFSLKSRLWLSFVLGCSTDFLCSSLVSAWVYPDLADLAQIHIFLFFLSLVAYRWSHPPILWDILVVCGWGFSPSPLTSEECQSFSALFEHTTTRISLWDRQKSRPEAQVGSKV